MTNIDEMLKTAQECANEADALRSNAQFQSWRSLMFVLN